MYVVTRIRIIQNVGISNTHFENVADFRYLGMMVKIILHFTKKELQEVIQDAQEICVTQNMQYAYCRSYAIWALQKKL